MPRRPASSSERVDQGRKKVAYVNEQKKARLRSWGQVVNGRLLSTWPVANGCFVEVPESEPGAPTVQRDRYRRERTGKGSTEISGREADGVRQLRLVIVVHRCRYQNAAASFDGTTLLNA